jgi:hypothetical protein
MYTDFGEDLKKTTREQLRRVARSVQHLDSRQNMT